MSNETPKTPGVINIRYVVMSVLNRLKDYSMRHYEHLAQLAIETYTDLNIWHLDNVEVVYLYMTEAKTVSVPADFIDWVKVGVPVNGRLRVLTQDRTLLLPRKFEDGKDVGNADAPQASTSEGIYFFDHFRNGQYVGGLYGMPGGVDDSYYRYDREKRQFLFSGTVARSEIVLEYISSGVSLDGTTLIPREVLPALRTGIIHATTENDPKKSQGEKDRALRRFEEECTKLTFFQSVFTKDEYLSMVRQGYTQTAKR